MWEIMYDINEKYRISDDGLIQRCEYGNWVDKYIESKSSRNFVSLTLTGRTERSYGVDSLVAHYFLHVPFNVPIFHIDGDYSNDKLSNLSLTSKYIISTSNEDEIWKDVEGYEQLYQVSNLGNVRSYERIINNKIKRSTLLKGTNNHDYMYVTLYDLHGGAQQFAVHRLVAYHFLDTPSNYKELDVNHKDFNTRNNSAYNLEWATRLANVRYSSTRGRMNKKHHEAKVRSILKGYPVYCTTTDKLYLRWTDAENELRLWNGAIKNCLTKGVTSHGYSFRKVDKHSEEYREAFYKEFEKLHPGEDLEDYSKYLESAGLSDLLR